MSISLDYKDGRVPRDASDAIRTPEISHVCRFRRAEVRAFLLIYAHTAANDNVVMDGRDISTG